MNVLTSLSVLNEGEAGEIVCVLSYGSMHRRLLDLGFLRGSAVTCLFMSPTKDMAAYRICNTTIALRIEDANSILVIKK